MIGFSLKSNSCPFGLICMAFLIVFLSSSISPGNFRIIFFRLTECSCPRQSKSCPSAVKRTRLHWLQKNHFHFCTHAFVRRAQGQKERQQPALLPVRQSVELWFVCRKDCLERRKERRRKARRANVKNYKFHRVDGERETNGRKGLAEQQQREFSATRGQAEWSVRKRACR